MLKLLCDNDKQLKTIFSALFFSLFLYHSDGICLDLFVQKKIMILLTWDPIFISHKSEYRADPLLHRATSFPSSETGACC